MRARVIVAGDTITVDLTGTSPQTAGPTNVGPAMAPTGAFTIIKSFLDPGADVNSGAFRPLTVITPPGTIVNADPPAPCGGMVEVKYCVESAVMGALAQALDGKVAGDLKGGGNHCYVGGPDPRTGETFIFYEYPAGGTGAFEGGDGSNTVRTWTESDMTTLQPIEAVEQLYPVRIERTALREDSGGPGRWRGGLGLTREVRIQTSAAAAVGARREGRAAALRRVRRRRPARTNRFWVRRDGRRVQPSPLPGKVSGFPLEPGDVLLMELGRRRLRRSARARSSSGRRRRRRRLRHPGDGGGSLRRRSSRPGTGSSLRPRCDGRRSGRRGYACAWWRAPTSTPDAGAQSASTPRPRRASAYGPGAVVELVNPRGAPLRAWVASLTAAVRRADATASAEVAPIALRMLALAEGAEVEVRAVHSGILATDPT